jgi:hypothetical protein
MKVLVLWKQVWKS